MCHVYASTDPGRYECTTRSLRLKGCVTSVRLENEFWEILDGLARDQQMSAGQFISELYEEVLATKGEVANMTSMLRVTCAVHLHIRAEPTARSA